MKVNVNIELETPDFEGKEFFKEIKNLIEDIRVYSGDDKDTYLTYFSMGNAVNDEDERNYYWKINGE